MAAVPLMHASSARGSPQRAAGASDTTTVSPVAGTTVMFTSLVRRTVSGSTVSGPMEVMRPAQLTVWSWPKPVKRTMRPTPVARSAQGPGG